MSLKDLLPEGTFEELLDQAHVTAEDLETENQEQLEISCPTCGKKMMYDKGNPFRPFCSKRCRDIDLGAWASGERVIIGTALSEDEDGGDIFNPEYRSSKSQTE